ncbi:MAG TPA: hypothetical protein VGX76_22520 [Pirellulales bacterium]|jgi:hypothetical protein|nr:hypothetical protein [Pirellulales bacterium]
MATVESHEIPADLLAEMEEVARLAMSGGIKDREILRRIRERAEGIREEVFREHGLLDIGTPAIRELRDGSDV